MLPFFADLLGPHFGPARLLESMLFLIGFGAAMSGVVTFALLPKLWHRLPTDQGRAFAVDAEKSVGKPVSAGLIFIPVFAAFMLLVTPTTWPTLLILGSMVGFAVFGYYDDLRGFSELTLGLVDLLVSLLGAIAICQFDNVTMWLPLLKDPISVPPGIFIVGGALVIWLSINATNCTDGVDGLSGSLSALALVFLGGLLYGVLGHEQISGYLLLPHYPNGAMWSLFAFVMVGCLSAYLWFNSFPSQVLMGDAGSRPIGFLIGVLVLATGNPFLLVVVAGVLLANGATGLLKLGLLRFFGIGIFKKVRYPLHDHVRHNLGWSPTQVLMRFMILQAVLTPVILVLLIKIR
ncbi:MAG: phospho-N-acetylmuramoyl-pentapeptide-transferase [Pseudomonadota bacterium]